MADMPSACRNPELMSWWVGGALPRSSATYTVAPSPRRVLDRQNRQGRSGSNQASKWICPVRL